RLRDAMSGFLLLRRRPPRPTLFPSPTLFRSPLSPQVSSSLAESLTDFRDWMWCCHMAVGRCRFCLVGSSMVGMSDRNASIWRKRSEEHTSELQSRENLVCRLLLEKKKSTPDS